MKIKKNNSGVSLVELIVILAILGIMAGAGFVTFSALRNADVTKSTKNIMTCYNKLRTYTMSKSGQWKFVISRDDKDMYYGTIYHDDIENGIPLELGKYIQIYYEDENSTKTIIDTDNPLTITLKASTGGVNSVTLGSNIIYDSGNEMLSTFGTLKIERKSRESSIKIYYVTGKTLKE